MAQFSRNYDSLLESDEIMSWLLFDFDHGYSADLPADQQASSRSGSIVDVPPTLLPINVKEEAAMLPALSGSEDGADNMFGGSFSEPGVGMKRHLSSSSLRSKVAKVSSSSNPKKRPRESVDDLEMRVKELQTENADLHAHLLNVTQRTTEVQKQRTEMERVMISKLSSLTDSDQEELAAIVKKYTDIYADYGKCRQREVSFHLQQIEKLIIPTKTTKLCLWALQQDNSFFQKSKSPLYDMLSKELELTPEQTLKFQERRDKTLELLALLKESLDLLKLLKSAIEKKHEVYDRICGRAQSAANPKQTVKFLIWITRHADVLSKYIPGFSRNIHHTPNAEFVESEATLDGRG